MLGCASVYARDGRVRAGSRRWSCGLRVCRRYAPIGVVVRVACRLLIHGSQARRFGLPALYGCSESHLFILRLVRYCQQAQFIHMRISLNWTRPPLWRLIHHHHIKCASPRLCAPAPCPTAWTAGAAITQAARAGAARWCRAQTATSTTRAWLLPAPSPLGKVGRDLSL